MAFISSVKYSSTNEDGNTASVPIASTNVLTASASVATISQDTACAYIASQSSGSQIKFEDINQIDEDDIEEMDIKWNMALLSMRADKVPRSQDRGRRDNFRHGSKTKEQALKTFMAIDGVGWDWSYMVINEEDHALVADEVAPIEFALMANTNAEIKDLSWNGLPKCADDTVTDYSRASHTVESISEDDQNRNPSVSETVASPITSKTFIKFVKPKDSQSDSKTDKMETPKKPPVKYAEQYRKPNMKPNKRVKKNFTPRPVAHKPYRPSQRPVKTHMNDAWLNRTFFNKQAHPYTNKLIHRTSAVRSPSNAPWVPTVNKKYSPVNRKFSTGSRNFPTTNRKFPTTSRKFPTGSTKSITADMEMKGKAAVPRIKLMIKAIGTMAALGT
nr:hypothetical protein [Tanacetum cinerariifolium]